MKVTVKYLTKKERPEIDIHLKLIVDGVWLLYCDFLERYECSGRLDDIVIFEILSRPIFGIEISCCPPDLMIFGSPDKKGYHALIMDHKKYCEIMEGEDVNES